MNNNQNLVTGILAGSAAGLMVVAALNSGAAAIFLMFLAPASIYLATMGWGSLAGLISVISAMAVSGLAGAPALAVISALMLFAPAAWVGHLTNLAQDNQDGSPVEWYPLSAILFQLMLAIGAGCILSALLFGYSPEAITRELANVLRSFVTANPDRLNIPEEQILETARSYVSWLPFLLTSAWLALHVLVACVCAFITARSGRLARPLDDIAATINLPYAAMGLMVAGLAAVFLFDGVLADTGKVILGLTATGYGLLGLANLHLRTRGNAARGIILAITYILIVLVYFPLFIFTATGLMRSFAMNSNPPDGSGSNTIH